MLRYVLCESIYLLLVVVVGGSTTTHVNFCFVPFALRLYSVRMFVCLFIDCAIHLIIFICIAYSAIGYVRIFIRTRVIEDSSNLNVAYSGISYVSALYSSLYSAAISVLYYLVYSMSSKTISASVSSRKYVIRPVSNLSFLRSCAPSILPNST